MGEQQKTTKNHILHMDFDAAFKQKMNRIRNKVYG